MNEQRDRPSIKRRLVVMAGPMRWLGATTLGVVGNFAYEKLFKREDPVEAFDLFPSLSQAQLIPGSHHPDEGFHPDIYDALSALTAKLVTSKPYTSLDFQSLPAPNKGGHLLLLGSPISNELTLQLHGHTFAGRKISVNPSNRSGFRWHFCYPESEARELSYSRYVFGRLEPKMRKIIIDERAPISANEYSSSCNDDGTISNDYLLITVQQNTFSKGSGTSIIEVSDLQGQGAKAFPMILENEAARRELKSKLGASKYFQALYEVPVAHDSIKRTTSAGLPKLVDVFRFGS